MKGHAAGVDADTLLRFYMPPDAPQPPSTLSFGSGSASMVMQGSHMSPTIDVAFDAPSSSVSGSVQFTAQVGVHVASTSCAVLFCVVHLAV